MIRNASLQLTMVAAQICEEVLQRLSFSKLFEIKYMYK